MISSASFIPDLLLRKHFCRFLLCRMDCVWLPKAGRKHAGILLEFYVTLTSRCDCLYLSTMPLQLRCSLKVQLFENKVDCWFVERDFNLRFPGSNTWAVIQSSKVHLKRNSSAEWTTRRSLISFSSSIRNDTKDVKWKTRRTVPWIHLWKKKYSEDLQL